MWMKRQEHVASMYFSCRILYGHILGDELPALRSASMALLGNRADALDNHSI